MIMCKGGGGGGGGRLPYKRHSNSVFGLLIWKSGYFREEFTELGSNDLSILFYAEDLQVFWPNGIARC